MTDKHDDQAWMQRALDLAKRGEGLVEPNPMVGCVLVKNNQIIGEGWHEKFGGPHAEVNAIRAATQSAVGATAYVTLEPCCHHGKTPPCTKALIAAQVARVVVAHPDPNPQVGGGGLSQLKSAGIDVDIGLLQDQAAQLLAPYLKRLVTGIPWVIAKWAMTLDGKIASGTGNSQWISNETSRAIVHQIRGRVDAIMVGARTAELDDPLLTARPSGPRVATRIVIDSRARLGSASKLCQTARQFPTLIAVGPDAPPVEVQRLESSGCEVWQSAGENPNQRLLELLHELGRRGFTNVLVEGGGRLLGALNDLEQIDEVHTFIGPKILGGQHAISPLAGDGQSLMANARPIRLVSVRQLDHDVYIVGRCR